MFGFIQMHSSLGCHFFVVASTLSLSMHALNEFAVHLLVLLAPPMEPGLFFYNFRTQVGKRGKVKKGLLLTTSQVPE